MSKSSIGKYILIDPSECPTRQELRDAIDRLKKDAEILGRMKTKHDAEPRYLRATAAFLERIYQDNRLRHTLEEPEDETQHSSEQDKESEE